MSEEESQDKQYEPSQKKLDDARRKGELPRSSDLNTAASYGGLLIAGAAAGASSMVGVGGILAAVIAGSDRLFDAAYGGAGLAALRPAMSELVVHLAPFFLLPAALALLSVLAQKSFVVAPTRLRPKISRISPLSNAKSKYGRSGLFEFAKSFVKLMIYSAILLGYLWANMPGILRTVALAPGPATVLLMRLAFEFLALVLVVALAIGLVDAVWQRAEHHRRHRMSRKEMMDEQKQSEGDPHMKQQRRQRGQEIATNRMLSDVPTADVVMVNPQHYAVALSWNRARPKAPVCVAKGADEIAARIRSIAAEAGVPIYRDPPATRALHQMVEVGHEIRPEHYAAVAAAIRFADEMRRKARTR